MQKWEYCAVVGVGQASSSRHLLPEYPALWHFAPDGCHLTEIKGKEALEIAKTIATLGEEGWEMVGCGNTDVKRHTLYFKRPKP
ncbi:MAG: hypothetical protein Q8O86_14065 [Dehalococcoidia bacterium]|nr:hypothetical protein [Dehalococcoidia bacterium]